LINGNGSGGSQDYATKGLTLTKGSSNPIPDDDDDDDDDTTGGSGDGSDSNGNNNSSTFRNGPGSFNGSFAGGCGLIKAQSSSTLGSIMIFALLFTGFLIMIRRKNSLI